MANETIVPYSLDDFFQTTPIGSIERAIGNNLYGINHRQVPGMVSSNKDMYGLTFFTRPQLNLQSDNIRNERKFFSLLSNNSQSIHRAVRTILDPRLIAGYEHGDIRVPAIPSMFVDNNSAFIPYYTNNLNSISGWPDMVLPTFTSESGVYNESFSMGDGVVKNYESFDIEASFRNTRGEPILFTNYVWLHYIADVFEGTLIPYLDFITENEIDYNTRIYRLVLDQNKQYVKKIAACGAAFPISNPTGSFFDFNAEKPYNDQNKDISIRFRCMGAIYLDDILVKEFNETVTIFNPMMSDNNRAISMIKLGANISQFFNNRGYPRINPDTYELEWWVTKSLYNARSQMIINNDFMSATNYEADIEEYGD